jgi:hypothetical protein
MHFFTNFQTKCFQHVDEHCFSQENKQELLSTPN